MMDRDMIDTSGMDIEVITKITNTHSTTFDMPTRKSDSPWTFSFHITFVSRCVELPESKISDIFLSIVFNSGSLVESIDMFLSYKDGIISVSYTHLDVYKRQE